MDSKPYVGITGPINRHEVESICREFSDAGYSMESPHIPMLGFLVSYKTLNGQSTKNRRYSPVNGIPELLRATDGKVLTMIHYNTKEMETLYEQVSKIFNGIYDSNLCHAIQMNIVWPDAIQVKKIKDRFPNLSIVFQASHNAMADKSPKDIVDRLQSYDSSLNYVLIDPSGGRGLEFDLESSLAVYSELREQLPRLTVGFAGGFTGENVAIRLKNIIERTGDERFCIDAEGGLRDKITSEYGDDLLNIAKVKAYLKSASSVIK